MIIEVKGVQFVNKGAELMLYAVIQQLQDRVPNARLVLEPGPNSPYDKRAKIGALQKFSIKKGRFDLNKLSYFIPKRIRSWLINSFGIVLEADVDIILDASGFAYGDQWGSTKIKHLCNEILRMNKSDKKYIFLPQALGPFTRDVDVSRLRRALPKATLICAREKSSYDSVTNIIGKHSNIVQFGDFTNLVNPIVDQHWRDYTNLMLIIPNYNMMSDRNVDSKWKDNYLSLLAECIKIGDMKGMTPVILNHEGHEDEKICTLIRNMSEKNIEIFHEQDSRKVKGIISVAKLIVCSRFHGCVSALSQGVPCLGTSWSHKYEHLFDEYGLSECLLVPNNSGEQLESKMSYALEHSSLISETPRTIFKKESSDLWDKVVSAIK
ncbi:polysaccharide pyruvyl transferase family protein [uncultured Paraglaciecola sp.]|uniref:polysaccharide pyruvyl transferase family protein n=1 Tax=uncultured Paraglaciecola sp. TaxID=1765024 RepID=UPI0025D87329|nr:polysaccharide pyruvyl transferase family protein [uncultured Paraglaciecola sp.]